MKTYENAVSIRSRQTFSIVWPHTGKIKLANFIWMTVSLVYRSDRMTFAETEICKKLNFMKSTYLWPCTKMTKVCALPRARRWSAIAWRVVALRWSRGGHLKIFITLKPDFLQSSCVIGWYSTECSIKLGTRFWELWNIEFMQKKDVPFWDSLSVKGRVPIFGRSLFNHANRVGAGALVPPLLEMASFMLVDCGVIWVRFPALPPMILLEEKDRVRPRRRVLEHWAAVEAGRAFCVGCCETETDMWLMETQFAP